MSSHDKQICEWLNARNEKGLVQLYETYYRPLVVWAATFTRDLDRAEDLVQHFFIRLWERKGEPLLPATLKSLLFVSVRNLALNQAEKIDPLRNSCDVALLEALWEEYDDFEEEVMLRVSWAVNQLPPRSREVVTCVYLKGMRYKETAQYLGVSVSTVNTLLVQALRKLRNQSEGMDLTLLIISRLVGLVENN